MLASGHEIHQVIGRMRSLGFGKIDCMKMLRDRAGYTLRDAKDMVHLSPAWADRYESDEALHDVVERPGELAMAEEEHVAA